MSGDRRKSRPDAAIQDLLDYLAGAILKTMTQTDFFNGYAAVNDIQMYYEVHGAGKPLVLIHGGGSTIESTFARAIPLFARSRKVIALELQAHGRTSDRDAEETFEQDADDVAALLGHLNIESADFFGFSNGATTTLQIAIRHPHLVNRMVLGSPLARRSGVPGEFWEFMKQASLDNMPKQLQEAFLAVNPDPERLRTMQDKDARRMLHFSDIPESLLGKIAAPSFIINGDKDVITLEHVLWLHKMLNGSELAVFPGVHGEYIGEITTLNPAFRMEELVVPLIERFLDKALKRSRDHFGMRTFCRLIVILVLLTMASGCEEPQRRAISGHQTAGRAATRVSGRAIHFPIHQITHHCFPRKGKYVLKWENQPVKNKIAADFVKKHLVGYPVFNNGNEKLSFRRAGNYYYFDYADFPTFSLFIIIYDDECGFDEYYQYTYSKTLKKIASVCLVAYPGTDGGQSEDDYLSFSHGGSVLEYTSVFCEDADLFDVGFDNCYQRQTDSVKMKMVFTEFRINEQQIFAYSRRDTVCMN